MRKIVTAQLELEPQVEAHAAEMFEVLSDPAIYEFENHPPISVAWLTERFRFLEARQSKDGSEQWLNWVIRLPDVSLAGYVQATVFADGASLIAYELNSRYWRRGIGSAAVVAMLRELKSVYRVTLFVAVLKAKNIRSHGLLHKLGFQVAGIDHIVRFRDGDDEIVMTKAAAQPRDTCAFHRDHVGVE